jgi:putative ABC transport system ATP-binding protein
LSTVLETVNIKKSYQMGEVTVTALKGISLRIAQGDFVAILGPSGSGKSTMLHVLGGLDKPEAGEVLIENISLYRLDDNKLTDMRLQKIGFVFQFFNLLPRLTALRNVELPLTLANLPERESKEKAREMLELVGLGDRLTHRPTELSGGEQQRVAIARALINDPKIVLADEPTGNLDTTTGGEIVGLMKRLNKEKRQTFVVVTHDIGVAENADRIVFLKDGLVQGEKKGAGGTSN